MRVLLGIIIAFVSASTWAGEMSKIDLVVRETVANTYSQGWDDESFEFDMFKDIWGLKIEETEDFSQCLLLVSGYAKKPSRRGEATYMFWVCVNHDEQKTDYVGEFLDDDQIADE